MNQTAKNSKSHSTLSVSCSYFMLSAMYMIMR